MTNPTTPNFDPNPSSSGELTGMDPAVDVPATTSPSANVPATTSEQYEPEREMTRAERKAAEKAEKDAERAAKEHRREAGKAEGSFAASTWVALIVGFLLLIGLIIFILQNQEQVTYEFITWTFTLPAGISVLIFAIAGALIMALVGGWRILELRRQMRKQAKLMG